MTTTAPGPPVDWQAEGMTLSDEQRTQVGERVRRERRARGLTISGASRAAGVVDATWLKVERGQPVRDDKMRAILRYLGTGPGGGDDPRLSQATDEQLLEELARRLAGRPIADPLRVVSDFTDPESMRVTVRDDETKPGDTGGATHSDANHHDH